MDNNWEEKEAVVQKNDEIWVLKLRTKIDNC